MISLLVACGADDALPPPSTSQPNSATTIEATDVGDVSLVRSGGLAGTTVTITVHTDGRVETVVDSGPMLELLIGPADLERLHDLIAGPEFGGLSETYIPPEGACCDRFMYTVTAEVGGNLHQSTTADGIATPQVLTEVIGLIESASPAF